jgi:hypothetical protein
MGQKGAGEQVVKQELDPATQAMQQEIFRRAQRVSQQGYTPYTGQTVANGHPLSYEGVGGMRGAYDQFGRLGDYSLGHFERLNQMGGDLNNLGAGFGRDADRMHGMAGQFDDLAGRMRGRGDTYHGYVGDMLGLGGRFDQQASGLNDFAKTFDARGNQMDQWGSRFNDYASTGRTGARALGGDQASINQLMNPYQQQVLDAVSADYDRQRARASVEASDAATKAGAFGGSRHGVMEGTRLGELDHSQLGTMAGLRAQGFEDTMARAGQAANLGFGAGEMDLQGRQLGQGERGMGLDARQLAQQANRMGLDARGLGATFGGLGLGAEQAGQGYNQIGLDYHNLGATYDNLGLGARNAALGAYGTGLNALNSAGQFAQGQAGIAGDIFNAGNYFRNVEQQRLDDARNQWLEKRDWNVRNLDILKGGLSGMPYGSTTREPLTRNAGAGFLGGAATGAGIGSAFGPLGTGVGAGLGGLFGLFG